MFKSLESGSRVMPLAAVLASSLFLSHVFSQTSHAGPVENQPSASAPAGASGKPGRAAAGEPYHYESSRFPGRASRYYGMVWGVDSLAVKRVESGEMIRFSYRVLDGSKAKALNDKKAEPYLIDEQARVKLVIPTMDKVGKLRQSSSPESGRLYWMLFSNKGGLVKRGDMVSVVIGNFHADGLGVE